MISLVEARDRLARAVLEVELPASAGDDGLEVLLAASILLVEARRAIDAMTEFLTPENCNAAP